MNRDILTEEWKVSDLNRNKDCTFELEESDKKELIDAPNLAIKSKRGRKRRLTI